jgi:ribosomal-protein-alanine N-acetyltransferase
MTRKLLIRRAGLADVRSIWAIEKSSFPAPWSRWTFLAELSNPISTLLVAGPPPPQPWETWGYIIYWIIAEEMHVLNLAVHADQRRRGIAWALLTEALTRGRAAGATASWLEVRPSNQPARALYESFGFKEVAVRPQYYTDTQEDALILVFYWQEDNDAEKEGP